MSQNVTFNGQVYVIPDLADNNWGQNVTDYLVALPQGALQKTGGSFTLAADVDFGAVYGLKAAYFKTRASNPASAGLVRLANTDTVVWRNAGNSADLALAVNGSNQLTFNGIVLESDTLPSGYIFVGNASNESTAVAMTGDIGIDNTGLTAIQNGVIINTDINASAAIAVSKLAALTASKSVVSDGSGFLSTGWAYAGGDMQTTINGALRFTDGTTNYVGLAAPAAVTTHTYLLPIAAGLNGQVLSWTTGGQLAWINASGTGTINSGTAGRFAYYPSTGTTLSDQALLTTNGTSLTLTSGQFLIPDGSVSAPSLCFASELDKGWYYSTGTWALADAGANLLTITGSGRLRVTSNATVSLPDISWLTNPNTGFSNPSANVVAISANGFQICSVDSAGLDVTGALDATGEIASPTITRINDNMTNPIVNGGFEEWTTTSYSNPNHYAPIMKGWAVRRSDTGLVFTVSREDTNVDSGEYALKLDITTAPASKVCAITQSFENFYPLYIGKTITISCRVKTSTAGCKLTFFDGSTTLESSAHTGGGGWETLSITRTFTGTGRSTDYNSVFIGYYASGSAVVSTLYIDSVMMSVSDIVQAYTEEKMESSFDRLPTYNFFVNGGFEIWQRGTGFTNPTSGDMTADRWYALKDGGTPPTIDYGQSASSSLIDFGNGLYSMAMNITAVGTGATIAAIGQSLSPDMNRKGNLVDGYTGSIYTASIKVKTTLSNIRMRVSDGAGGQTWYSKAHSGSGSYETLSVTFSPYYNGGTNITVIVGVVDGTVNQTGLVYFDSAILSYGPRPIPFVPEDPATELIRCQRYYEKSYALGTAPGTSTATNLQYQTGVVRNTNDVMTGTVSFKVQKSSSPTVTLYTQGGTSGQWSWTNASASKTNRVTTADQINTNGFNLRQQVAGTDLFGEGHWIAISG